MTDGRSLVRNSALNIVGLVVPLILAVIAIPPLVRGFGVERFGILTLAWATIGYFSLFDAGLSRALTHAVARRIGAGAEHEIAGVAWTTLTLLAVLGSLAAFILIAVTPVLVERALNVPLELQREARASFWILALALPLVLTSAGLRGLMEAHHDFAAVNAIRLPLAAFTFLGPLLTLPFSRSLVPAVVVLVVGRLLGGAAHIALCVRRYPYMRTPIAPNTSQVIPLLRFGGWATVTNIVGPLLVYMDRFLIGAVLSVAAVTYYVTPYEVVTKLIIIPGSVLAVVFPAFAATFESDRSRMAGLYERAQRIVLLVLFPLILPAVALAHEGLRLWMGAELPAESALVLQWLGIGVFINAIAHAPLTAMQGAGRPDLVAKVHLAELPFYLVAIWLLLRQFGIVGVAIAWTLRATVDTLALLLVGHRTLALPLVGGRARTSMALSMLAALVGAAFLPNTISRVIYVVAIAILFTWMTTRKLLTPSERAAVLHWIRSARQRPPRVA